MINNKNVLAIIPARGGSKGLPGKNVRDLCGKPLIQWSIEAALNSRYIDKVIVTTDDENIANIARSVGADIPFIRPKELASDESPSSEAILHALDYFEEQESYEYFVLLEPTSPLTESKDIDQALFELDDSKYSSIVGIANVQDYHPEFCVKKSKDNHILKFNGASFDAPSRRQDLEPVYSFDGSLYISRVKSYKENKTFYHSLTLGYLCEEWKRFEIDTLTDFIIVEAILNNIEILKNESK